MSDGQTKLLRDGKRAFLENCAITYPNDMAKMPSEAGLCRIDVAYKKYGKTPAFVHEITAYASRDKAANRSATKLYAYWLPWVSKKTVYVDLDDSASMFLTSEINGCTVRVGEAQKEHTVVPLRIAHIAGDSVDSANSKGSEWRNKQGEGIGFGEKSRRFSSGGEMGSDIASRTGFAKASGTLVGYGDTKDTEYSWHNVVGFNCGLGRWEIYAQSVRYDNANGILVPTVQQLWPPA